MTEKNSLELETAAYILDYKGKNIFMDGNDEDNLRDKTKLTAIHPDKIDDIVELNEKVELVRRSDVIQRDKEIIECLAEQQEMRQGNTETKEWSRWEQGYKAAVEDFRKELLKDVEKKNAEGDATE